MFKSIKHVDQANASPFFQQYAESNLNSLNLDDFMFVHNADTLEFNNSGLEFTSTNYNLLNDENYDTEIDFSIIDSLPKTDQSQIKCDETAKCLGSPIQSPMYFLEGLQSIYIPPNYHDNKTVLKQGKDNCIIDFTSNVADKNANITDYFENNNSIRHKQLIIQSNKLGSWIQNTSKAMNEKLNKFNSELKKKNFRRKSSSAMLYETLLTKNV